MHSALIQGMIAQESSGLCSISMPDYRSWHTPRDDPVPVTTTSGASSASGDGDLFLNIGFLAWYSHSFVAILEYGIPKGAVG